MKLILIGQADIGHNGYPHTDLDVTLDHFPTTGLQGHLQFGTMFFKFSFNHTPGCQVPGRQDQAILADFFQRNAGFTGQRMAERNDDAFEKVYETHGRAVRIFSPRVFHLIREALDVHSIGELVRYARWTYRNQGRLG